MLNKVFVLGRLTKDPEVKKAKSGKEEFSTLRATVAVDRLTANKEKETDFIQFSALGKNAENIAEFLEKGNRLLIEGSWRHTVYDKKDGTKGYLDEIRGEKFTFIDWKDAKTKATAINEDTGEQEEIPF